MSGKAMVILQSTIDKINGATPTPVPEGTTSQDNFMQLMGLVFLLIVILIAAYYTSRFVGGIKLGQMKNSNFHVIDAYRISPNKIIQIVKIGNKFIVIAIGKDTINYITELDEAEVLIKEIHTGEKLNFKQVFEKLRNNNE